MWTDSLYRLQSGKKVAVDFSELQGKRILLANINRTHELSIHHYCDYLLTLRDRFHTVMLMIHNENRWQATTIATYYPQMDVVLDRNNNFLRWLAGRYKDDHDTNTLLKKWNFQVLIEDNSIKDFYDVPVSNRYQFVKDNIKREDIKSLYNDKGHYGIKHLNSIFGQSEHLVIDNPRLNAVQKTLLCRLFFYPGIWPNTSIESLEKIK